MTNNQRASKFAEEIKRTYAPDEVIVCWNLSKAKKYGILSWIPETVAFACVYKLDSGGNVTAVVPIAKRVLFAEEDNTPILLAVVGRYLMNHFEMEKQTEAVRMVNEVLHG